MEILLTEKAEKQLNKIAISDIKTAAKIVAKIRDYAKNPQNNYDIKLLKGDSGKRLRLRVGNYRIIFNIVDNVMKISLIKHRQEAYND